MHTHIPLGRGAFRSRGKRTARAVDGVSFLLERGEILGLVGESGCGKSTLGRSIIGLERPTGGEILLDGVSILHLPRRPLRRMRRRVQMIFQDPYASLNPRMTVYETLAEALLHEPIGKKEKKNKIAALLQEVKLDPTMEYKYPHELSGGQRQRIAIARAMANRPELLIADEPVSSLDVSIQAQILNLLKGLQERHRLCMLFVSHDLAVVRFLASRTAVMYLGRIVEIGPTAQLFEAPRHPYTRALLQAIPTLNPERRPSPQALETTPARADKIPSGCRFHPRCPEAREQCRAHSPTLQAVKGSSAHQVACLRAEEWASPGEVFPGRPTPPAAPQARER